MMDPQDQGWIPGIRTMDQGLDPRAQELTDPQDQGMDPWDQNMDQGLMDQG